MSVSQKNICVDITKALAIDGWMSEPELMWLAERAAEHCLIVEIGSYLGRSTRAMLDNTAGILYAFDDWKGPRDVYMDKEERTKLFDRFCNNVEEYIVKSKVMMLQADYAADLGSWLKPDMVFIDGSHEYEDVKRDIERWLPRIIPGGLICGHDIKMTDVASAVMDTLGDATVAANTTIWWKIK